MNNSRPPGMKRLIERLERARRNKTNVYRGDMPDWCPGCGHFAVLKSLCEAAAQRDLPARNLALVSGGGTAGRLPYFMTIRGLNVPIGCVLPAAAGVKAANPALAVVAVCGDEDVAGRGAGYLAHAARNGTTVACLILRSHIAYPQGTPEPVALAIACGAPWVARAFAGEPEHCTRLMIEALSQPGFVVLEVISPCCEQGDADYAAVRSRVTFLSDEHKHDRRAQAADMAASIEPIYLGVFVRSL